MAIAGRATPNCALHKTPKMFSFAQGMHARSFIKAQRKWSSGAVSSPGQTGRQPWGAGRVRRTRPRRRPSPVQATHRTNLWGASMTVAGANRTLALCISDRASHHGHPPGLQSSAVWPIGTARQVPSCQEPAPAPRSSSTMHHGSTIDLCSNAVRLV